MTTIATAKRYLRTPLLPKSSPVVVLHLKADNDRNGNPQRCFVVLTLAGHLVEVHDEEYSGDQKVKARWPWLDHNACRALGLTSSSMTSIKVTPAEYKNWIVTGEGMSYSKGVDGLGNPWVGRDRRDNPDIARLRDLGTRCAQYHAVCDALINIRRQTAAAEARKASGMDTSISDGAIVVYHRHPDDGGDEVSEHLRRALIALTSAGMIERVPFGSTDRFHARSVGRYRATDTTPTSAEMSR